MRRGIGSAYGGPLGAGATVSVVEGSPFPAEGDVRGPERGSGQAVDGNDARPAAPAPSGTDGNLVLDELEERFERFRILRKTDSAEADRVLDELGAHSSVDRDIVLELSSTRPLGHPERFPDAHALVMRSIEVLDRNGGRGVKVAGLGPLGAVASPLVQLVARFIVRSHQATVIDAVRHLYARREASCAFADPARPMLSRARIHAERVASGYKRNPIGLPSLLIVAGGAALSSLGRSAAQAISATTGFAVVATIVSFLVFGAAAWIILRGAAVARRRIRLTVDRPLEALWETIGRCGRPPRDQARQFAFYAILLTALGWIVVPIGLGLAFAFR